MRGLHGKRPGVQVERAPEGACEGPPPWQRRGAWKLASGSRGLIFRHAGTRVLTDDTQNAFSESLQRRASGAPVEMSIPTDSWPM